MTPTDLWALSAAGVASCALALRANMLKPHAESWFNAPARVWYSMLGASMTLAVAAGSIWLGHAATGREALAYSGVAIYAVAMLWNLAGESARHAAAGGAANTRTT